MRYLLFFLLLITSILFSTCGSDCDSSPNLDIDQTQLAEDITTIDTYLANNGVVAEEHPSGLRYVIKREGDGGSPSLCDNVTVTYEGRLLGNSTAFESQASPISLGALSGLITGWQIGIPLIKPGGRITLYIPSGYGYGETGSFDRFGNQTIPPNAILQFEILLF